LVVVALRLSVVSRGQAIGVLATKGIPLRIAADREKGRAYRVVDAAPSFQTCFACVHMYILYACVYLCVGVYVCGHDICMMCWMFINNQNARKPPVTIGTYQYYRYLIWVLGYIPYMGLAVFSSAVTRVPVYTAISNF